MSMREKVHQQLTDLFQRVSGEIAQAGFRPGRAAATWPARSARRVRHGADATLACLAHPGDHKSGCSRARFAFDDSWATVAVRVFIATCVRSRAWPLGWRIFIHAGRSGNARHRCDGGSHETRGRSTIDFANHREVKQAGVTADELTKAKKIQLNHQLDSLTTMRGQASDLGSNWLLTRNLNFSRDYLTALQKVTLDDIRRVAAKYLVDQNLTIVSLNPKGRWPRKASR